MDPKELRILEMLDDAVKDENIARHMVGLIQRVEQSLKDNPKAMMAWEPIPLDMFRIELPKEIKSCWVFNLRKNMTTGAERHPNSIQRMRSYQGSGDFQTRSGSSWESHFLESDPEKEVAKRWLSIPVNVWHQGVVYDENWVVLSFHTAEVSELMEERADESDGNRIHAHRYADQEPAQGQV